MQHCRGCGFDYADHHPPEVVDELAAAADRFTARLRSAAADPVTAPLLHRRPGAGPDPATDPGTDTAEDTGTVTATDVGTDPGTGAHSGPEPHTWSALEYAGHVRDLLLVQRERLLLALITDTPHVTPMHRDDRIGFVASATTDPDRVVTHLQVAAELLVAVFAGLDAPAWHRRCIYNFPAPTTVDLAWLATHTLHECVHHRADLDRVLEGLTEAP